jgi:hypothetical protein
MEQTYREKILQMRLLFEGMEQGRFEYKPESMYEASRSVMGHFSGNLIVGLRVSLHNDRELTRTIEETRTLYLEGLAQIDIDVLREENLQAANDYELIQTTAEEGDWVDITFLDSLVQMTTEYSQGGLQDQY